MPKRWVFLKGGNVCFSCACAKIWSGSFLATVYLANKRTEMENFKLSTVAATLGVQVDGDSLHNAMYDIELTKAVFDIVTDINV